MNAFVLQYQSQSDCKYIYFNLIYDISFTGSGAIEFNEFTNLMAQRYSEIKEMKEITDAFKMFDRNGDGVISAGELRQVMTNMGKKLSDKDVDSMMKEADMDGDGQINYAGGYLCFTMVATIS